MKNFYSIVVDGYPYYKTTEERFDNDIQFLHFLFTKDFAENILDYEEGTDVYDFLECENIYPGNSYVAINENGEQLEDLKTPQETFDELYQFYANCNTNIKRFISLAEKTSEYTSKTIEELDKEMFEKTPYKGIKFERLGGWGVDELPKGYSMPFFKFENGDLVTCDRKGNLIAFEEKKID